MPEQMELDLDIEIEESCDLCGDCLDDCSCWTCEGCDRRYREDRGGVVDGYCTECERCDGCECDCRNGEGSGIEFTGGRLTFHTAERNQFKDNPLARHLAVELEIASCESPSYIENACYEYRDAIVSDGSLPDTGFELKLNPSNGDVFFRHVEDVCNALADADAEVNSDCGMHVHVDARDLKWLDLHKLCILYGKFEEALFKMLPRSRQNSNWCKRSKDQYRLPEWGTFKQQLLERLYGHSFPAGSKGSKPYTTYKNGKQVFCERSSKYESCRYYALNLHSFFYRGTVEFRHAAGTTNTNKVKNWALVCGYIVDAASKMSLADINALPLNSTEALLALLPESVKAFVIDRQGQMKGSY